MMVLQQGGTIMKLRRYWAVAEDHATDAKGRHLKLRKWGGSNESREDAMRDAKSALAQLKQRVSQLEVRRDLDDYAYSMRDVPEELVKEMGKSAGITRNGKGCLVLNTENAVFADIDIRGPGLFDKLFGKDKDGTKKHIDKLQQWLSERPQIGVRVYRTRNGLRYLFTHALLPVNDESIGWLKDLGSDRLYVQLCKNQKSFRARLTPKPHRVACERPPGHYPYEEAESRDAFAHWLSNYEHQSQGFAVCRFVGSFGSSSIHRDIAEIVKEHDRMTRCDSELPLA